MIILNYLKIRQIYPPEFPYDENVENAYEISIGMSYVDNAYDFQHESHIDFERDELIIKYNNDSDNYIQIRDDWIEKNCYNTLLKNCPLCRTENGFSFITYQNR